MQPLIDADILRYEVGAVGQYIDPDSGELAYRNFDWVATALDDRIRDICGAVGATTDPIVYLTGSRKELGDKFIPNFREAAAVGKPYKGTRKAEKPFHYHNLTAYITAKYDTRIANGCEADDLISIEQFSRLDKRDTIICTRDKDLRMCPGLHYGWECGKQPEMGPVEYDDLGSITLLKGKSGNKIVGGGKAFFFAQLLTGDVVDNIGGARRIGPVKAYAILSGCKSEQDYRSVILSVYKDIYPEEDWLQLLREQSSLLWIVRELNEDGTYKGYEWPDV